MSSGREIAVLAGQPGVEKIEPAITRASFNSDGTRVVVLSGERSAEVFRVFPTPQQLIDYAKGIVPRDLTPCERRRFFLPVEGDGGGCPR